MPAPTATNILDCGITKGPGNFTCGYRINDPVGDIRHPGDGAYSTDQNADMNYLEGLWIDGATDEDGGTPTDYQDGMNSCGLWINGTQVQAGFFTNLNIRNCGTGVFVNSGQIEVFGGTFENNVQPPQGPNQCMRDDNHGADEFGGAYNYATGQGGGDFVFQIPFGGGHVIQNITSTGSYHFITGFLADYASEPPSGLNAHWQNDSIIAVAVVGCNILSTAHPSGDVVFLRGNGGPIGFYDCNFGGTDSTKPQKLVAGQWTQGSIFVANSKFNHNTGNFYEITYEGQTNGIAPKVAIVDSRGWNGTEFVAIANQCSDQADLNYQTVDFDYDSPRSRSEMPVISSSYVIDMNSFRYNNTKCRKDNWPPTNGIDNGTIINAAIADVKAHGGGTIWFPSGSYVLRVPILLEDANGVQILGTGGRNGIRMGDGGIAGTQFTWDGAEDATIFKINRSKNIIFKGISFSTWYCQGQSNYTTKAKNCIHISQTGSGGYPTENIWLEDTAVQYGCSSGNIIDDGICETFIRVGDGPLTQNCNHITAVRVSASHVEGEVMLIDGPDCTDIKCMQFGGVPAKRIMHISPAGGAFSWFGGGGGNNLYAFNYELDPEYEVESVFTDPVVIELENATGPIYSAGHEYQDNYPTQFLRTSVTAINRHVHPGSGKVYVYGENIYFGAPKNHHRLIDFKFTGADVNRPEFYMMGCTVGWAYASLGPQDWGYDFALFTPEVAVENGSVLFSMANAYSHKCYPSSIWPWDITGEESFVQDICSRGFNVDHMGSWPWMVQNWKFYNSNFATYRLEPHTVARSTQFNVDWRTMANYTPLIDGDSDIDGTVRWQDLEIFCENWCLTDENLTWRMGDYDGSHKIDFMDFVLLADNWLASHQVAAGDWVGIFAYPGTPGTTSLSRKDLVNIFNEPVQSGTTKEKLTAPATPGTYELRYYKGSGTDKCVYKQILHIE